MRGESHALTGAAAWLAVTSTSAWAFGVAPQSLPDQLAGALLCAGAAMAPDWDHPDGTVAHSLKPFTRWTAEGISAVSGGHRGGTHSFLGILAAWGIAMGMSHWTWDYEGRTIPVGSGICALFLMAFAVKVFGLSADVGSRVGGRKTAPGALLLSSFGPWVLALVTAGSMTYFLDYQWTWLPLAVALGAFVHICGDMITPQGVWWFWPLKPAPPKSLRSSHLVGIFWRKNGRFRVPLLGTVEREKPTGIAAVFNREAIFAQLVTLYIFYILAYEVLTNAGNYRLP